MSFGSDVAPRLLHFLYGIAAAGMIWWLCRRYYDEATAHISVAIFLATPVIMMELAAALVDLAMALFFLLAVYAVFRWHEHKPGGLSWFLVAGIFAGAQMGCKYQGVYGFCSIGALIIIIVLFEGVMPKKLSIGRAMLALLYFILPAVLVVLPWLIKNSIMVHNPVYPNLAAIFGGKYWSPELSKHMSAWLGSMGMGKGIEDFLIVFWNLPIKGFHSYNRFAGIITPFYFLPIPLLLLARRYWKRSLYFLIPAMVYLVLWFPGSQQVRFLIPALGLFAILSGAALAFPLRIVTIHSPTLSRVVLVLILFMIILTGIFTEPKHFLLLDERMTLVFDHGDKDTYLVRDAAVDNYPMTMYINENLPAEANILMLFENRGYYLERDYIAEGTFEASRICAVFANNNSVETLYRYWKNFGVTHVLFNHTYWGGYSGDFIRRFHPTFENNYRHFSQAYLTEIKTINNITLYTLE